MTISPPPTPPRAVLFLLSGWSAVTLWGKYGDQFLITVLVDQKIKIPVWYGLEDDAVMLFDSYLKFEWKLGVAQVISYGGIDEGNSNTSCSVWIVGRNGRMGCRNGRFNEQFQILPLELKVKFIWMLSYVFLTVLDLPARYICYTSCWQVPQNGGKT